MLHNTEIQLYRAVPEKQLFERSSTPMATHTAKISPCFFDSNWVTDSTEYFDINFVKIHQKSQGLHCKVGFVIYVNDLKFDWTRQKGPVWLELLNPKKKEFLRPLRPLRPLLKSCMQNIHPPTHGPKKLKS